MMVNVDPGKHGKTSELSNEIGQKYQLCIWFDVSEQVVANSSPDADGLGKCGWLSAKSRQHPAAKGCCVSSTKPFDAQGLPLGVLPTY